MAANPARGELNRENDLFPVPVRALEFGLNRFCRLVLAHSLHPRLNLVLIYTSSFFPFSRFARRRRPSTPPSTTAFGSVPS